MKKILIVFTALVAIVIVFFVAKPFVFSSKTPLEPIPQEEVGKIEINPTHYDLAKILMKNGVVTKEYEIKNYTSQSLVVKKIVTSCMCTRAYVTVDGKSTSTYGMEMSGDKNPRMNFEIPSGSTAKLVVKFDPAAHGIQGVGKFDRTIWLTFADPVGVKQFTFNGEVALE